LSGIMSKEGMKRFRAYLHRHPDMTEIQKRRVVAAFIDKFALEGALEQELDLPGWNEALINNMSDLYEEDSYKLERMPSINMITP